MMEVVSHVYVTATSVLTVALVYLGKETCILNRHFYVVWFTAYIRNMYRNGYSVLMLINCNGDKHLANVGRINCRHQLAVNFHELMIKLHAFDIQIQIRLPVFKSTPYFTSAIQTNRLPVYV